MPTNVKFRIGALGAEANAGISEMALILKRPFAGLERQLRLAFAHQANVRVIVDRRNGDRRRAAQAVAADRRRSGRRGLGAEMMEVVLSL
jgi:hypothetical protein